MHSGALLLPEYAEIYGVPFSFIPGGAGAVDSPPPPRLTRVRALTERQVAFRLAKLVPDQHLRDPQGNERPSYFPQDLPLVQEWLREHVVLTTPSSACCCLASTLTPPLTTSARRIN